MLLRADTPSTVRLVNRGTMEHVFAVDELEIRVTMPPGETVEIEIDAPAGTYDFYCAVPGHREEGLVAQLVVE